MTKLQQQISIQVWGTSRTLVFTTTQALIKWAKGEVGAWRSGGSIENVNPQLQHVWNNQVNQLVHISNAAQQLDSLGSDAPDPVRAEAFKKFQQQVDKSFDQIRRGTVLTTDHPRFDDIAGLAQNDMEAAVLLLASCLSNGRTVVEQIRNNGALPFAALIRSSLGPYNVSTAFDSALRSHRDRIQAIQSELDTIIALAQHECDRISKQFADMKVAEENAATNRNKEWDEKISSVDSQWTSALKAYDEKMALAAPTTYWQGRAKVSMFSAIAYGAAFVMLTGVSLYIFGAIAIPHLVSVSKPGVSILTAVLPVLIPAFAAVWLLRILGRLLSESVQLMQDARERSVMVMTFLALMHDEVRGKSLVTDDDRLLILHSLFRPSAVSATDDAPPVHWFDILSKKLGKPG